MLMGKCIFSFRKMYITSHVYIFIINKFISTEFFTLSQIYLMLWWAQIK